MIEFTDNGDALTYRKRIPVRHQADVFIAGGGPAGVAAGVAAARQGADVFIAETYSAFGGAGVNMLVPAFMTFGDGENFLAAGIGREVYDYIASKSPESFKKHCPMSIPVETLKRCYDDMIADSGARFQFHTSVIDVIKKDGIIEYAVCAAKHADGESLFAVRAKVFIDCTGDGDLAVYAGAEYEYGDEEGKVMPATLCGIWAGIDWPRVVRPDSRALEDAFADGVFTHEDRHHSGMWRIADLSDRPDSGIGGSNVGHVYDINGADAADLTRGIVAGRRQLPEYRRYYREYLSGYENTELISSGSRLGIRETRRIVCDYRLTLEDFRSRAVFDDEIGRYCYPVDIHPRTYDKESYRKFLEEFHGFRYKKGESYGIPYRCMTVKGIDNLLTAGRCVSADRYMQSSIRVMPGCYITGQAAGVAATMSAAKGGDVRSADTSELGRRLIALGACLPNHKS